jgi:predicted DNA-binding protein with PD1-like motif
MIIIKDIKPTKIFMGKLTHGADLLDELTLICKRNNIRLGRVDALGAVRSARLGFYEQVKREYQFLTIDQHLEITHLIGNVSIKDGQPMVHAHLTLSDDKGRAFGGHLVNGTIVFACEVIIRAFDGPDFIRGFDQETGLPLWNLPEQQK